MPSPRGGSPFLLCLRWLGGALSPWGEVERGFGGASEGLQRGFESSYTLLYIYAREVSVVTVMTALTFVGTNGGGC